jgi:hypothetical protein
MSGKWVSLALAGSVIAGNSWAGGSCVSRRDEMALRTAVLQQQLMVAAFSCGDVSRYNEFVVSHQGELQQSDAALLAFFIRENGEGGTAGYHTFKTKAANLAALQSARDLDAYCENSGRIFDAALTPYRATLASFVESQESSAGEYVYATCSDGGFWGERTAGRRTEYGSPAPHAPMTASFGDAGAD